MARLCTGKMRICEGTSQIQQLVIAREMVREKAA